MRKFILLLLLLSVFMVTINGENGLKRISLAGRALSTEGKTVHKGSPQAKLILGQDKPGFLGTASYQSNAQGLTPAKIISASGTDLQGFLKASSSASYPSGWYDININGDVSLLFSNNAMMGSCGFVRKGRICQFTALNSYGYYWFYYSEYSLETGEQLYEIELPDTDMRNYVVNCTYNENEDMVYMQTYSKNFSSMAWSSFNPETHERTYLNNSLSWEDNRVVAISTNPRDNKIYGIKDNGDYVEIDRLTGNTAKIASLSVSPAEYSQSMVYAPIERGFVWAAMLTDNTSGFYRIEPATGEVSLLGNMPVQNQFLMLYSPDNDAVDSAPGMPGFSSIFTGPSLDGELKVELPSKTFEGKDIDEFSDLIAEINIDGEFVKNVEGKPGKSVATNVTLPQGEHNVVVRCRFKSAEGWGPEKKCSFYVGYDSPTAPTMVAINGDKIEWEAPANSVHGGYVDFSKLQYTVMLNNVPVTTAPTRETSISFEEPASLAIYHARVYAEADGMTSEPGISEGVKFGEYLDFPFSFTPTSKEFELFTVVDGNGDDNYWKFFEGKDCVYYNVGNSGDADEWLLLPKADFSDTGHLYRFSFEVKALLSTRPEDFEIWLLDSEDPVTGQVKKIAEYPAYDNDQWSDETFKFNVENSGKYHIAFHCTTPSGFQLMLQNIRCEKSTDTMKAPAECKGVKLTGSAGGSLEASVSFLAPTKALDGTALPQDKEITVFARTRAGEASAKVLPGKKGEITFPCQQGMNVVTLVCANDGGEGMEQTYEIFAGQEKPGKVQNLTSTVSDDNLSWTITWDAPTEGESGGYINPDEVGYYIYNVSGGELNFLEDIGTNRSYTVSVAPGQQSLQQIAVGPYNVAGAASSDTFRGTSTILGTPLEVPFTETFGYGIPNYLPNVIKQPNSSYTVQWSHGDPTAIVYEALTSDYGCMYAQPTVTGISLGRVEIPRVSTKGYNNICFKLRAYRFPQGGLVRILGRVNNGDNYIEIGEFDCAKGQKGYVESIFKLPAELQDKPWISLAIEAEFDCENTNSFVIIDEYTVVDLPDNDLAVESITGTDRLTVGQTGHYAATVSNRGKEAQTSSVDWEVVDVDGNVILSDNLVVSPLNPEETEDSNFSFVSSGDCIGTFTTVRATVVADPDDSAADDSKEMKVAMISAASGKVDDLTAESTGNIVDLKWSAPQMKPSINEDFATLEHGVYGEELGQWKNFDGDRKNICSINGVEVPDAGQPKAWQVIDESLHELFSAHKGTKMLMAITPSDESAANDWLISPEVEGGSEVVFTAQILATGFVEEFEVLASSTDDDPASFHKLATFEKDKYGWETYMVKLPADARYFAIRYCSVDQFGLLVDDIDYVSAETDAIPVARYNVYRDNSLIGATGDQFYKDDQCPEKAAYYVIPVISENGNERETVKSNSVSIDLSGITAVASQTGIYGEKGYIRICGHETGTVSVATVSGIPMVSTYIDSADYSISLPQGIYIVALGGKTAKVIVK